MVDSKLALGVLTLAVLNIPTTGDTTDASTPTSSSDETTAAGSLIVDGLAQLPANDLNDPALIMVADLDAVTEANDLQRPTSPEDPDGGRWMMGLTGVAPNGGPPPPVFVAMPRRFFQTFDPSGFADIVGWSIIDVGTIAAIDSPPDEFIVVGDEFASDDLSSELVEVSDGVVTDREGDDHMQTLSDRGPVDFLGRPVRFAAADGRIALGLSTEDVESWLAGTAATLADDASLLAIGTALDDAGVISAQLIAGPAPTLGSAVGLDPNAAAEDLEELTEELSGIALDQPYDALGAGSSVGDTGAPLITLAYHFASADAAADSAERLGRIFTEGASIHTGQPLSEFAEVLETTSDGEVAVVTLAVVGDANPMSISNMMLRGDLPFVVLPS
ncbi:MAG: hypothetical protein ACK5OX_16810 [Desertimonas sp.]